MGRGSRGSEDPNHTGVSARIVDRCGHDRHQGGRSLPERSEFAATNSIAAANWSRMPLGPPEPAGFGFVGIRSCNSRPVSSV